MMRTTDAAFHALASVLVLGLLMACCTSAVALERGAVLVSFEHQRIGPEVACDGSVRVSAGEIESLQPVLFEPTDGIVLPGRAPFPKASSFALTRRAPRG